MESARTRARVSKLLMYIILIIMAFIMLVPFAWMILTALKTNQESISVDPFYIFPASGWHWENFVKVWQSYNFVILYKNTLLMILFRVICACLTATMAGYAFGRLRFPGKNLMFSLVLIQMMIPSQIFANWRWSSGSFAKYRFGLVCSILAPRRYTICEPPSMIRFR